MYHEIDDANYDEDLFDLFEDEALEAAREARVVMEAVRCLSPRAHAALVTEGVGA
ncbi:MAG: hypothetical protein NXI30_12985 [bacterium]|nr:hypothetical protein [bacterium]